MLIGFQPIFVADTKIIYGYNFVAPLMLHHGEKIIIIIIILSIIFSFI